jgi:hypothetical protein
MPNKRRAVDGEKLHELLTREFTNSAAGLCSACRVPRPIFRDGAVQGPNWGVPSLAECDSLCHTILQDIAAKLGREYDMAKPRKAA